MLQVPFSASGVLGLRVGRELGVDDELLVSLPFTPTCLRLAPIERYKTLKHQPLPRLMSRRQAWGAF